MRVLAKSRSTLAVVALLAGIVIAQHHSPSGDHAEPTAHQGQQVCTMSQSSYPPGTDLSKVAPSTPEKCAEHAP